jgi:hypothetical protein
MNQQNLETSEEVDQKNSSPLDFFLGMNLETVTVFMIGINEPSMDFQRVGGLVIHNEDKKWLSTARICTKRDPLTERQVVILAKVHDALAHHRAANGQKDGHLPCSSGRT